MLIRTCFLNGEALDWATKKAGALGRVDASQIKVNRGNDLIFTRGNADGDYTEPLWLATYGTGRPTHGRTQSEAAERCHCEASFGETIDIPDGITNRRRD